MNTQALYKESLIEAFGKKIGTSLFGAAIKLSNRIDRVDLADVVGEITEAALEVEAEYGFVHITTAVRNAKNAILRTANYGPTEYYQGQGVCEISADKDLTEDGARLIDLIEAGGNVADEVMIESDFEAVMSSLPEMDRKIAAGFALGLSNNEIADTVGCHFTTVSRKKSSLREAFADFV
jgi:DNA-binding NarL/FixJ family response regulator